MNLIKGAGTAESTLPDFSSLLGRKMRIVRFFVGNKMKRSIVVLAFIAALYTVLSGVNANAQIRIDISGDDAPKAVNEHLLTTYRFTIRQSYMRIFV